MKSAASTVSALKALAAATAMAMTLTSCDETIHIYPEPAHSLVILQLNIDREPPSLFKSIVYDEEWTRSESEYPHEKSIPYTISDDYVMRITVEVYEGPKGNTRYSGSAPLLERRVIFADKDATAPQDTIHLNLPDGEYHALAWADYVPAGNTADWHYVTSILTDITTAEGTYPDNTHLRSSAAGTCEFAVDFNLTPDGYPVTKDDACTPLFDRTIPVNLSRPSGRFRLLTGDLDRSPVNPADIRVRVAYRQFVSTGFSVLRDEPAEIISSYYYDSPLLTEAFDRENATSILCDYIFTYPDHDTDIVADFYFSDPDGKVFNKCTGIKIPVRRNHETVVSGLFLTTSPDDSDNNSGIAVDDLFDGEYLVYF